MFELLIVLSIVAVLGGGGVGFYQNFSKDVELKTTMRVINADLRTARAKSMARQDDLKWGVHFVNDGANPHYYELFSTPTDYANASMSVSATTTLSKGLTFSDPSSGTKDIIFYKVAGTTTASTVGVTSSAGTQTLTISALGTIY